MSLLGNGRGITIWDMESPKPEARLENKGVELYFIEEEDRLPVWNESSLQESKSSGLWRLLIA